MNAAKIIVCDGKRYGILEMFKFFGKPQCQAGQPPVEKPQVQMRPVNIGGADFVESNRPEHLPFIDGLHPARLVTSFCCI